MYDDDYLIRKLRRQLRQKQEQVYQYQSFITKLSYQDFAGCRRTISHSWPRISSLKDLMQLMEKIKDNAQKVKQNIDSHQQSLRKAGKLDFNFFKMMRPNYGRQKDQPLAITEFLRFFEEYNQIFIKQINNLKTNLEPYLTLSKTDSFRYRLPFNTSQTQKNIQKMLDKYLKHLEQQNLERANNQFEKALKHIYNFSGNKGKLDLMSDKNKNLLEDISNKLKAHQQRQRIHTFDMEVKNKELKGNRQRMFNLEEMLLSQERRIKEKLVQINSTILQIPLTKDNPLWLQEVVKLDDMVQTVIQNTNKAVSQFFEIKYKNERAEKFTYLGFGRGRLGEVEIEIPDEMFESFRNKQQQIPEQIFILQANIKQLVIENKDPSDKQFFLEREENQTLVDLLNGNEGNEMQVVGETGLKDREVELKDEESNIEVFQEVQKNKDEPTKQIGHKTKISSQVIEGDEKC